MFCLPRIAFKNTFAIGRTTKRTRAGRHLSDPAAGGRWGLPEVYIALVNSMPDGVNFVDQHSTADAKIALFRSLFRGRDDVYPRRFESRKTGKSGYVPACANEWVRDRSNGGPSRHWISIVRPFLPDSRHLAARRIWESHCASSA